MRTYRAAILFFGGFTQRRSESNGIYEAFDRTYRKAASADTHVAYFPWIVDPAEVAGVVRRVDRSSQPHKRLRLAIVGYSFGGHTAVQVCEQLAGLPVDRLVLCDPVARWCGRLGWSRALINSTIRVPINVRNVALLLPKATAGCVFSRRFCSRAATASRSTTSRRGGQGRQLSAEHADIDNAPEFQDTVDEAVRSLLSQFNPRHDS